MTNERVIEILKRLSTIPDDDVSWGEIEKAYAIAINAIESWEEIKQSGMPTLVIEDTAYILTKGHVEALVKYNEEQNIEDFEEFTTFLKEGNKE